MLTRLLRWLKSVTGPDSLPVIGVVFHHVPGPFLPMNGGTAVELFFCVSGFYMALVLERKYVGRTALFYENRFLRLFPAYVLLAVANLVLVLADRGAYVRHDAFVAAVPNALPLLLTNLTVVGQEVASFLSIGKDGSPFWDPAQTGQVPAYALLLIPQTWSISLEILFYAIAPFIARRNKIILGLLVASLAVKASVFIFDLPYNSFGRRFFPSVLWYFLAGMLAYRVQKQFGPRLAKVPKWVGVGCIVALLVALYEIREATEFQVRYLVPAIALFTCALIPLLFSTMTSKFETFVGELSYPIYLSHTLFLGIGVHVFDLHWHKLQFFVVVATIGTSIAIFRLLETPVDRWRQRRLHEGKVTTQFAPVL